MRDRLVQPVLRAEEHREVEVRVGVLGVEGDRALAVRRSPRPTRPAAVSPFARLKRMRSSFGFELQRASRDAASPRPAGPASAARFPGCCALPRRRARAAAPRPGAPARPRAARPARTSAPAGCARPRPVGLLRTCSSALAISVGQRAAEVVLRQDGGVLAAAAESPRPTARPSRRSSAGPTPRAAPAAGCAVGRRVVVGEAHAQRRPLGQRAAAP